VKLAVELISCLVRNARPWCGNDAYRLNCGGTRNQAMASWPAIIRAYALPKYPKPPRSSTVTAPTSSIASIAPIAHPAKPVSARQPPAKRNPAWRGLKGSGQWRQRDCAGASSTLSRLGVIRGVWAGTTSARPEVRARERPPRHREQRSRRPEPKRSWPFR
jgi:hypothetical protein